MDVLQDFYATCNEMVQASVPQWVTVLHDSFRYAHTLVHTYIYIYISLHLYMHYCLLLYVYLYSFLYTVCITRSGPTLSTTAAPTVPWTPIYIKPGVPLTTQSKPYYPLIVFIIYVTVCLISC